MKILLSIMVLAIISIAGSRLTFLRKKLPYGFRNISLTGTEYIFIGILLGQMGLEFLDSDALFQLNPFLVFGLCWIGFLFGLQFDLRNLKKIPRTFVPITFVQSLFTFTLVSVAMTAALFHFSDMPGGLVIFVALVLGSASSCTAQSAMAVLERSHRIARPRLVTFLRYVSGVDGLWALIFFMVTLSIFPESGRTGINWLHSLEGLAMVILIGLVSGFILISISRVRFSQQEFSLFLVGTILFCGGLADTLNHSPLIAGFICGLLTANFCKHHIRALSMVLQAEKSIYIFLLLVLGASWQFGQIISLLLGVLYFVIRIMGKMGGNYLGIKIWNTEFFLPETVGLGLLAEGGLTVAIILDFRLQHPIMAESFIPIIMVSIFLNEWLSPRLLLDQFKKNPAGKRNMGQNQ